METGALLGSAGSAHAEWSAAAEAAATRRQRQVALMQALANERRLRVLEALVAGERSVGALVTATRLPQNQVSTALSLFASLGFVRRRRDGRRVFYTLADSVVSAFLECAARLTAELTAAVAAAEPSASA